MFLPSAQFLVLCVILESLFYAQHCVKLWGPVLTTQTPPSLPCWCEGSGRRRQFVVRNERTCRRLTAMRSVLPVFPTPSSLSCRLTSRMLQFPLRKCQRVFWGWSHGHPLPGSPQEESGVSTDHTVSTNISGLVSCSHQFGWGNLPTSKCVDTDAGGPLSKGGRQPAMLTPPVVADL